MTGESGFDFSSSTSRPALRSAHPGSYPMAVSLGVKLTTHLLFTMLTLGMRESMRHFPHEYRDIFKIFFYFPYFKK